MLGLNLGSQVLGCVCVCVLVFLKTCQVSQKKLFWIFMTGPWTVGVGKIITDTSSLGRSGNSLRRELTAGGALEWSYCSMCTSEWQGHHSLLWALQRSGKCHAFSRLTFMTKGTPVLQCQRNTASGVMSEAIVEILSGLAVLHHTNVKIKVHFLTEEE